jgi:hypothetical protein
MRPRRNAWCRAPLSGRGVAFFFFELYKPNHGNKGNSAVDDQGSISKPFVFVMSNNIPPIIVPTSLPMENEKEFKPKYNPSIFLSAIETAMFC